MKLAFVVIHDSSSRREIEAMLRESGYHTRGFEDGSQAFAMLTSGPELPEAILLDPCVAGMDGWSFRERQSEDNGLREIPVILILDAPVDPEYVKPFDGCEFVRRPVDRNLLLAFLARAITRRRESAD